MIKLKNVSKSFGKKSIISNYNLTIEDGDFILIFGKSGCGKSTLLNLIGSLEKADNGAVEYNFDKLYNTKKDYMKIRKEYVSYVFQNFALLQSQTVLQNLMFSLKETRISKSEKSLRINEELQRIGMGDRASSYVYELSGGEQQRIAVARAILKPHKVILADEPTGNLDETNSKVIMDYLKELNNNSETIVVVSHDDNLKEYANKIIYMDE